MSTAGRSKGKAGDHRLDEVIEAYEPLAGIPDEFIDARGRPRPHWLPFLRGFLSYAASDLDRRFDLANRHMRETGVSYRAYGDTDVRPWPLSHVPLLISEAEWAVIADGVAQRAGLIEAVLADIYGANALVDGGHLPAAAVAGSRDFLPPLHGVRPAGGRFLNLYAVDIGRGPDGRWWVLGDRTQAPSGAGYALENRLAMSRGFSDLYAEVNLERLAPFFQQFRSGLASQAERADPRICLLTPGPLSETYFEQAYLARYLGFLLVEGADLTMRAGQIHVRTIAGLKRADVIWRRIDAGSTDPLELEGSSRLGVPGFVEAVRSGGVVVGNALGTGVMESSALMSVLPKLAKHLLGEPLRLPNIATWWCGQPRQRQEVLDRLDTLAIADAFNDGQSAVLGKQPLLGAALTAEQRQALREGIAARGVDFVGQEVVRLSTTPVWEHGRLVPRPFVLRVFAAPTSAGWTVMPGGFCRVANKPDARVISMAEGVRSTDVCIVAEKPVGAVSLLPTRDKVRIRRLLGNLPSRAADNLFWLGRYLERTEATLRLVRCVATRVNEGLWTDAATPASEAAGHLLGLLTRWGAIPEDEQRRPGAALNTALHDGRQFGSAFALAREARRTASIIQERLSGDAMRLIGALVKQLEQGGRAGLSEAEALGQAVDALNTVAAVSGLMQENVNRVAGWRFLEIGRRIERGTNTCRFAQTFAGAGPAENLDVLLDLIDSQITYRSRYLVGVALAPVRDMVVLDPFNPRSVAFQVERVVEHLATLPPLHNDGIEEEPLRLVRVLSAEIASAEAADLELDQLLSIDSRLVAVGQATARRYFLQGALTSAADKFMGLA